MPGLLPPSSFFRSILFIPSILLFFQVSLFAQPKNAYTLDEVLSTLRLPAVVGSGSAAALEFRWDPFFQSGVFALGDHHGVFTAASTNGETGPLMLDGKELFTLPMPYPEAGQLVFPEPFVRALKDAFARSLEEDTSRFRIAAIIIDPGHGGKDPGAIGNPTLDNKPVRAVEKDIVLEVSKRLKDRLARAYPGKRLLMTRDRDVFYSLEERVAIANSVPLLENEAVIYISVHANYVFNSAVRGYEVWYLSPDFRRNLLDKSRNTGDSADILAIKNAMLEEEFTTESVILAQSILRSLGQTLGNSVPSRGIKAEEWFVVRNSRMPAVLVELGFVSNPQDAALMTSGEGLRKLTDALYNGIVEFTGVFERSGGFTASK
jgi:N-acetylmuramoyl-L-alanine amidase